MSAPFFTGVFDYEIRRGIMHISLGGEPVCATPLEDFMAGHAKSARVVEEYYARNAEVMPMRRRSGE